MNETLALLGVSNPPQEWVARWAEAQSEYEPGMLPVLCDGFLEEVRSACGLDDDIVGVLAEAIGAVSASEPLTQLLWAFYRLGLLEAGPVGAWPVPVVGGRRFGLFPAVVALAGFPRMVAAHTARGIAPGVSRGNCRDLAIWMRHERRLTGEWGLSHLSWIENHLYGRLYRIGRLQFIHQPFNGAARAYREGDQGTVIAVAAAGVEFRSDGLVNGTNGQYDEKPWVSALSNGDNGVQGYPIHPDGRALSTPIMLDTWMWREALVPGDPCLDIHIPEDGRMDYQQVLESLRQAPSFFATHFPELPRPRAFSCSSWLLDSQYGQILPPESNMARFVKLFYTFPICSDDSGAFWRVFDRKPAELGDLTQAPRDTGLRRAMLDFRLSGGRLHDAGGFIPLRRGDDPGVAAGSYWRG